MTTQTTIPNAPQDEVRIRPLEPRDRSPIEKMVVSSGKLNDVEIATALELVEEAVEEGGRERLSVYHTGARGKARHRSYTPSVSGTGP